METPSPGRRRGARAASPAGRGPPKARTAHSGGCWRAQCRCLRQCRCCWLWPPAGARSAAASPPPQPPPPLAASAPPSCTAASGPPPTTTKTTSTSAGRTQPSPFPARSPSQETQRTMRQVRGLGSSPPMALPPADHALRLKPHCGGPTACEGLHQRRRHRPTDNLLRLQLQSSWPVSWQGLRQQRLRMQTTF